MKRGCSPSHMSRRLADLAIMRNLTCSPLEAEAGAPMRLALAQLPGSYLPVQLTEALQVDHTAGQAFYRRNVMIGVQILVASKNRGAREGVKGEGRITPINIVLCQINCPARNGRAAAGANVLTRWSIVRMHEMLGWAWSRVSKTST